MSREAAKAQRKDTGPGPVFQLTVNSGRVLNPARVSFSSRRRECREKWPAQSRKRANQRRGGKIAFHVPSTFEVPGTFVPQPRMNMDQTRIYCSTSFQLVMQSVSPTIRVLRVRCCFSRRSAKAAAFFSYCMIQLCMSIRVVYYRSNIWFTRSAFAQTPPSLLLPFAAVPGYTEYHRLSKPSPHRDW